MSLTLYFHPLSSFCQKVLIALYENETPFTPRIIDFSNAASRAELLEVWPIGRFPVLRDETAELTIPESSIIIEYLPRRHRGGNALIPADADLARQTRLRDRFYDLYVEEPMQKIVGDMLRPAGAKDPHGVEQARALLQTAYGLIDRDMEAKTWAMGEAFTMADCAAAPALMYAHVAEPIGEAHRHVTAYLDRLMDRPSFARAIAEARPYFAMFPLADRFLATYGRVLAR